MAALRTRPAATDYARVLAGEVTGCMRTTERDATGADVERYREALSNWGRFGEDDQLGTLNLITPERRVAAARSVVRGRTVCCARPLPTAPALDNANPAQHHMLGTAGEGYGADWFSVGCHGYATSHIDALCHIFGAGGRLYNGYGARSVTAHGAEELAIAALRDGVVGRGVLLDIPHLRGVPYLEAGAPIQPADLEAAEDAHGVRVGEGDILLVRTGRWALRAERGAWDPHEALAGLQAACLPWLHERGVAALGSDGVSDVVPSRVEGVRLPIHEIAIPTMGLHLLDNLELEAISRVCVEESRWTFLLTLAPLVIEGGTGSPLNPIALF